MLGRTNGLEWVYMVRLFEPDAHVGMGSRAKSVPKPQMSTISDSRILEVLRHPIAVVTIGSICHVLLH